MKLFTKYLRVSLPVTVVLFIAACVTFFFVLNYILLRQVDEDLRIEQQEIVIGAARSGKLPDPIQADDQKIVFERAANVPESYSFYYLKAASGVPVRMRKLEFPVTAGGISYKAIVSKSTDETDTLLHSVVLITVLTIILLLAAALVINGIILKRLWKPFYSSIQQMEAYRPGTHSLPVLAQTDIKEFSLLNDTLKSSMNVTETEYEHLKKFTEDAAHEMQTPLAVIRTKLDLLIQSDCIAGSDSELLKEAYTGIAKLAKLNRSLVLITRIENNQYPEKSNLNLTVLLQEKIAFFRELTQEKELHIVAELSRCPIFMNGELLDILLNNLFSNAVRHTVAGGYIKVQAHDKRMIIANNNSEPALDEKKIFRRFYKTGTSGDNTGLGLSIAELICRVSDVRIAYDHTDGEHRFALFF